MNIFSRKTTRTGMRTAKTQQRYYKHMRMLKEGKAENLLADLENRAIKKFKHWLIIKSDFPYDNVAEITDILFTRRKVEFNWHHLNKDELNELMELREGYLLQHYSSVYENLSAKSVPHHFHLILLKLKKTKRFK